MQNGDRTLSATQSLTEIPDNVPGASPHPPGSKIMAWSMSPPLSDVVRCGERPGPTNVQPETRTFSEGIIMRIPLHEELNLHLSINMLCQYPPAMLSSPVEKSYPPTLIFSPAPRAVSFFAKNYASVRLLFLA